MDKVFFSFLPILCFRITSFVKKYYENGKFCSKRQAFSVIIYIRDKSQSFYYGYL
ncbi:hypothetical protein HMPREF0373_01164 [Eubacterium ramulus ATCC 29099]|uniref:Uncharacterized protein n=1 Tax=Eubacterium ramulus ATCC 29099 TaxID=1256908 RepID=U2RFH5_EUBRA|nr:hypothetical protein HMPREF0373_01164 [Eubacterium ramulus ATCC 29099]